MISFELTCTILFVIGICGIFLSISFFIIMNILFQSDQLNGYSPKFLGTGLLSFLFMFALIFFAYLTPQSPDNVTLTLKEDTQGRAYLIDPINNQIHYPNQGKPGDTVQRYKSDLNYWKFPFYLEGIFVRYTYRPISQGDE